MTIRSDLLKEAIEAIDKGRNVQYGPPSADFSRTAALLSVVLDDLLKPEATLAPYHVSMIMICLKLSRLCWDPSKKDTWMDIAGYAGCGYETIVEEEELREQLHRVLHPGV